MNDGLAGNVTAVKNVTSSQTADTTRVSNLPICNSPTEPMAVAAPDLTNSPPIQDANLYPDHSQEITREISEERLKRSTEDFSLSSTKKLCRDKQEVVEETIDASQNDKNHVLFHSSTFCADLSEVNIPADERLNDEQQCTESANKSLQHEESHQVALHSPSQQQRLQFGSKLPRLVAFATSTLGWNCTKGCSWFPTGDRLLVPCEDARSEHIRGQYSLFRLILVYGSEWHLLDSWVCCVVFWLFWQ